MFAGRTIVVGVAGGIAAYKACELVRWLRQRDAAVIVVMTPAACEFVTPLTFQTLSGNPVVTGLWGDQRPGFELPPEAAARVQGRVEHVDVAEAADCIVVAPATANLLARLVHGEAPDALGCTLLASRAPVVLCPAMDLEMWRNAATRENVRVLASRGVTVVPPDIGFLASGLAGPGRLPSTEVIGAAVERALARRASLAGLKVLVSAGRTEEAIDPVRVLTNRSSGRMGVALAEAALARGAAVTLVAGPMSVDAPARAEVVRVTSAAEMAKALTAHASGSDVVLMAAAVADYRPAAVAREKLKRGAAPLTLTLTPNPDILAGLAARRGAGQVFVGFALETSRGVARARAKLKAKGVDLVVLNSPADGIGGESNAVTLVDTRAAQKLPRATKREVAEHILDRVLALRSARMNARARTPRPRPRPAAPAARLRAKAGAVARGAARRSGR
jgi:phosphopantothenoylcysteine decarboxylase / phosphopantothenate---cysteine ligase